MKCLRDCDPCLPLLGDLELSPGRDQMTSSPSTSGPLQGLSQETISRSEVLQIYYGGSCEDPASLPVPVSDLQQWSQLVDSLTSCRKQRSLPFQDLLHGAQVCRFTY